MNAHAVIVDSKDIIVYTQWKGLTGKIVGITYADGSPVSEEVRTKTIEGFIAHLRGNSKDGFYLKSFEPEGMNLGEQPTMLVEITHAPADPGS